MDEEKYIIDIKHIGKKFGNLTVLKDISSKIKKNEVVVIIGPSGSGKSTFLRCLNGLETVTSGVITFDGMPLDGEKHLNIVRTEVGMVFQKFNLFPHMSVIQNIMLAPMKVRGIRKEEAYERGIQLLRKVGLEDKAKYKPNQLSGGQQQRVAIARALAMKPKVLLFDEPTSALDVTTQAQVVNELMDICQKDGTSIVLVTHNLGVAAYMSDQIMVMQSGNVVEHGTAEEVIEHAQEDYTKKLLRAVPQIGGERYDSIGA